MRAANRLNLLVVQSWHARIVVASEVRFPSVIEYCHAVAPMRCLLCDGMGAALRARRAVCGAQPLCYNSVAPRGTASKLRALHTNAFDLTQPAGCRSWRRMGAWPPALVWHAVGARSTACCVCGYWAAQARHASSSWPRAPRIRPSTVRAQRDERRRSAGVPPASGVPSR